jgi:hypothetical protein
MGFAGWMSSHSAVGRGSGAEGSAGGGVPFAVAGAAVMRMVGLPLGAVAVLRAG